MSPSSSRKRNIWLYSTLGFLLASVLVRYGVMGDDQPSVVAHHDTIPVARQRLEILRRKVATLPGKLTVLQQVNAELQQREKGIVLANTSEQARAHLFEVLRRTASANGFESGGAAQLPEVRPLGKEKEYGQVSVGQTFTCGIDQFVNFLSAIANEPEILATDSIVIQPLRNPNKDIQVRLNFSGVIDKKLIPVKKGDNF